MTEALKGSTGRISLKLVLITSLLLIASLLALSYVHLRSFESRLVPELDRKATAIAGNITAQVSRAVEAGVPVGRLRGVRAHVADAVAPHPEIRYVALTAADGATLFAGGFGPDRPAGAPAPGRLDRLSLTRHPVTADGERVARLTIGVTPAFAAEKLTDVHYDVLVTLLVSLFLTFEILLVVVALTVAEPLRRVQRLMARGERGDFSERAAHAGSDEMGRFVTTFNRYLTLLNQRQQPLAGSAGESATPQRAETPAGIGAALRIPLFLFFFASELSRPFLPLFAAELHRPGPWLSPEMGAALPLALYLGVVALLSPWAGGLTARLGPRRAFLTGLIPALAGFLLTGFADSLGQLLLWRGLNAIGFAVTTLAALGYITETTPPAHRARGMVAYTGLFMAAGVCGAAVGGILADRIGYAPTFFVSAAMTVAAAAFMLGALPGRASAGTKTGDRSRGPSRADFLAVLRQPAFLVLGGLAAVPTQLITTGYLFFTVPLMLNAMGHDATLIGRVMLVYFVIMAILARPFGILADRSGRHGRFAAGGLALAGLAGALLSQADASWFAPHAVWWIAASVAGVGLGHSLCIPAQSAILMGIAQRLPGADIRQTTAAISVYRLIERIGAVAGPLVAAALIGLVGHADTVALIGAYILVSGLLFLAVRPHRAGARDTLPPAPGGEA